MQITCTSSPITKRQLSVSRKRTFPPDLLILTYIQAYESLCLYEPAYKAYNLAHMWRESLYCATLVPLPETQLTELANTLATTLTDGEKDYVSAAHIHAQHLEDIPGAARLLCRGSQFGDACRLLALHGTINDVFNE